VWGSAAARANASNTAVPRTPDAPVRSEAKSKLLSGASEHLPELTCYNELHSLIGIDEELATDRNRTDSEAHNYSNQDSLFFFTVNMALLKLNRHVGLLFVNLHMHTVSFKSPEDDKPT
jgi:hypothetical protein